MSPVKIIHVLKRLEVLDRDIAELRDLESTLSRNRSYSNALKISVELQINGLLNERVKLMELRIDNPPEHLIPGEPELKNPAAKLMENRSKFSFQDLEEDYLDRLLQRSGQNEKPGRAEITPAEFAAIHEENLDQEEIDELVEKASTIRRSRNDLLRDLPRLEH